MKPELDTGLDKLPSAKSKTKPRSVNLVKGKKGSHRPRSIRERENSGIGSRNLKAIEAKPKLNTIDVNEPLEQTNQPSVMK